jgi:serine/threonine protein phosphatase PrpC
MNVFIQQPLGYSYQGGRSNNEDNIFPVAGEATVGQRWFMVCDGVGGAARGEIASHIAVEGFNDYFVQHQTEVATSDYLQLALDSVQAQFDDYLTRHPEAHGMATTLTLLFFHEAGATVAHIGDSRVYHLRDGKVIWRTEDHSLVNQLMKAGVITREEAREHPQRNVIERAIQGGSKAVKPDVQILNDIRPGDYFFLCTDGVLERVSDELLENVLGSKESNEQKKQTLIDCCIGKTKDNFSAYLVQIDAIRGDVPEAYRVSAPIYSRPQALPDETIAVVAVDSKRTVPTQENVLFQTTPKPKVDPIKKQPILDDRENDKPRPDINSIVFLLTIALFAAVLTVGGIYVYNWWKQPAEAGKAEQVAADHGKVNNRPRTDGKLPLNSTKKTTPITDAATVEGITQTIGGEDNKIEITRNLYKQQTESGWILVNEKGRQKGDKVYEVIREPSEERIAVMQNNKWGYINLKGQTAIACKFDMADDFEDGKAHVVRNGKEYDIDKKGEPVKETSSRAESENHSKQFDGTPALPPTNKGAEPGR